jgi:hypothetical protein
MWKAALAGVVTLAVMSSFSLSHDGLGIARAAAQDIVVTEGRIARLKNALKLTPEQERHWRPVEASLRAHLSREAAGGDADAGIVRRARARLAQWTLSASAAQRVSATAQPLISSLDETQKRNGMTAIRAMGVASLF